MASGEASQPRAPADSAAAYVAFSSRLADGSADLDLIVEGLRELAGAVGALEGTAEAAVDLRAAAEHVLLNPDAAGTTEATRATLLAVAEAMERNGTDASHLRTVAESIDRGTPLAKQQKQLVRFFVLAAASLGSPHAR